MIIHLLKYIPGRNEYQRKLDEEQLKKQQEEQQKLAQIEQQRQAQENQRIEQEKQRIENERLKLEKERTQLEADKQEQEESRLKQAKQQQQAAVQVPNKTAGTSRKVNQVARLLDRIIFPDVNTLYEGIVDICNYYSEDDPGACRRSIDKCKEFSQESQDLFKYCVSEYLEKLITLSIAKKANQTQ